MFELHPRLAADSTSFGHIGDLDCRLINDSRYPWVVLVPEINGVTEIHQLDADRQAALARVAADMGKTLLDLFDGDKLNVGALGNVVSQLHYHLVVRKEDDKAWPGPVWGFGEAVPYSRESQSVMLEKLRRACKVSS